MGLSGWSCCLSIEKHRYQRLPVTRVHRRYLPGIDQDSVTQLIETSQKAPRWCLLAEQFLRQAIDDPVAELGNREWRPLGATVGSCGLLCDLAYPTSAATSRSARGQGASPWLLTPSEGLSDHFRPPSLYHPHPPLGAPGARVLRCLPTQQKKQMYAELLRCFMFLWSPYPLSDDHQRNHQHFPSMFFSFVFSCSPC